MDRRTFHKGVAGGAAWLACAAVVEPEVLSAADPPATGPPATGSSKTRTVSGRVLDPHGQPLAGVTLSAPLTHELDDVLAGSQYERVGQTAADGTFRVAVADLKPRGDALFSQHPGFGLDWVTLGDAADEADVTLRLVPDMPIAGRVVDAKGQPIAGLKVECRSVLAPAEGELDKYLATWKKSYSDTFGTIHKTAWQFRGLPRTSATTDQDGRFSLSGIGAERIVALIVSGGEIASEALSVITRPDFDPVPYNEAASAHDSPELRKWQEPPVLYGPRFELFVDRGISITGTVTDGDTGEPLAACMVAAMSGFGEAVLPVRTDAQGRYRLTGLPRHEMGYRILTAEAAEYQPGGKPNYLRRWQTVPDVKDSWALTADVDLFKGAILVGRVIDKQTGQGVEAGVRLAPLPDNPFYGSKPGFDNYKSDRTMNSSEEDGTFRLVTIPGRALLMIQAHGGESLHDQQLSPYRRAVPEPQDKPHFKYDEDDDQWRITTINGSLELLNVENAARIITVAEKDETRVEIAVDRGQTATLTIVDADDQPVSGAQVAGVTEHWPITYLSPESSLTVYALTPRKPRTIVAFHEGRKIGGVLTIRGDEQQPLIVRLEPLGNITGRVLDANGQPLQGLDVSVSPDGLSGSELYRFVHAAQPEHCLTDADGRFELTGIVPGMEFYLSLKRGETYFVGKPKLGKLQVGSGATVDLGEPTIVPR